MAEACTLHTTRVLFHQEPLLNWTLSATKFHSLKKEASLSLFTPPPFFFLPSSSKVLFAYQLYKCSQMKKKYEFFLD